MTAVSFYESKRGNGMEHTHLRQKNSITLEISKNHKFQFTKSNEKYITRIKMSDKPKKNKKSTLQPHKQVGSMD
jgi:hypothetical protein